MAGLLNRLRGRATRRDRAHALYGALVEQARRPWFYGNLGVPDTVDGRFDMIVLHAFLVLRRLRDAGPRGVGLGQAVFEVMFADMDRNLREMGVGDLGVGRRVKAMTQAFMGRVSAYEKAMGDGRDAMALALERNIFRSEAATPRVEAATLADYVIASTRVLGDLEDSQVLDGHLAFASGSDGSVRSP